MEHIEAVTPKLITNNNVGSFYKELKDSLLTCKKFYFSVAFINYSGLQLLLDTFTELKTNNIKGKIITSTYLNFTDVASLKKLQLFDNIDTKIYVTDSSKGFHTKGYIFEYDNYYKIIVGSSNITQSALKSNIEWNVEYISKKEDAFVYEMITEFNNIWGVTNQINDAFLEQYDSFIKELKAFVSKERSTFNYNTEIKPNKMQSIALQNLKHLRDNEQTKALVIAATGTGKTYMSAFDVKQENPDRVLFLVHREVILDDAIKSFENVISNKIMSKFKSKRIDLKSDYVFAMIQSMSREGNYTEYPMDYFDYIIIDEAHRSFSKMYQKILNHFEPKFLLGMTATPERTDGGNIFDLYNNNIALEIRLREALKEELVIPFHYFGITDTSNEYYDLDKIGIDEISDKLCINERVDLILEKLEYYGYQGTKRKALGFCVTIAHAKYMSDMFNSMGYKSLYLSGNDNNEVRERVIKRLENEIDELEFVFTVDIFNEGVDIPGVNLVLMLRPTQSPIIFTQQLGRGLRKHEDKEFLTVLDFIGNHNKSFLIPIALSGTRYYERDSLKVAVTYDFEDIPGCTNIHLDRIVKEQILDQLDRVNFSSMDYLKKEYVEFKKVIGGSTPNILDYALYDNSPDPVKFIKSANSYTEFVYKLEKIDVNSHFNEKELNIIRLIDKMLPIKRINEFVLLKELFDTHLVTKNSLHNATSKLIDGVATESIEHSINYFSKYYFSNNEIKQHWFIKESSDELVLADELINSSNELFKETILSTLEYGIVRYQNEYGKQQLTYPYLKLYARYKMRDLGLLTNYTKKHSSIRGSGLWTFKNNYFLFVDLHKSEQISETVNYKDKIIDKYNFQWETPNSTKQDSDRGRNIIDNVSRGIRLHLLVRKAKEIGSQKIEYMYVGEMESYACEGNKPITVQMKFKTPLRDDVYKDLTRLVK